MTEIKDLAVQTKLDVAKLSDKEYMDGILQDIETQVKAYAFDPKTPDGRADIISLAYKVTQSKTHIVKTSDKDMESLKQRIKDRKAIIDHAIKFLDKLRDETRAPVTEWEKEQERIKSEEEAKQRELVEKRVKDLVAVNVVMPLIDVAIMTDEEFDTLLFDKTEEYKHEQARIAEEKRLEDERKAKEEAERKAEAERLAKQKAEQEAKEAELKKKSEAIAAAEKAIKDEKDRLAREKQARFDAENAKIKAEQEAKARVEREAKEAEEREQAAEAEAKRQAALLPDKEKLVSWIESLELEELFRHPPELATKEARKIAEGIMIDFENFYKDAMEEIESL